MAEVAPVLDAREQAHEEGGELGGWRMDDGLLGNGHLAQVLEQTDFLGELAPHHEHGVFGWLRGW